MLGREAQGCCRRPQAQGHGGALEAWGLVGGVGLWVSLAGAQPSKGMVAGARGVAWELCLSVPVSPCLPPSLFLSPSLPLCPSLSLYSSLSVSISLCVCLSSPHGTPTPQQLTQSGVQRAPWLHPPDLCGSGWGWGCSETFHDWAGLPVPISPSPRRAQAWTRAGLFSEAAGCTHLC